MPNDSRALCSSIGTLFVFALIVAVSALATGAARAQPRSSVINVNGVQLEIPSAYLRWPPDQKNGSATAVIVTSYPTFQPLADRQKSTFAIPGGLTILIRSRSQGLLSDRFLGFTRGIAVEMESDLPGLKRYRYNNTVRDYDIYLQGDLSNIKILVRCSDPAGSAHAICTEVIPLFGGQVEVSYSQTEHTRWREIRDGVLGLLSSFKL